MRVVEASMEQRRNERVGETGGPRDKPLIFWHDSHMLRSGVTRPGLNPDRLVHCFASQRGRFGFSYVDIVRDDAAGRRVFSGISGFPLPCIPALLHSPLILPSSTSSKCRPNASARFVAGPDASETPSERQPVADLSRRVIRGVYRGPPLRIRRGDASFGNKG
ncbi:hypothetical protein PR048_027710 [Dryococelus australis]|uniref:Uncharacterized protein n=1 Tax=Dryococelus australis TaxID=614101 RepID=A0ABQ9GH94_9NEOP|nr:hypothetical protein PR048_027710 [Dryococelus australis]